MMDDVIYRKDAIRVLNAKCKKAFNLTCGEEDCACVEYTELRELPSAQQWVSCSDQLPEEFKSVLCCTDEGEIFIAHAYIFDDGNYSFDDENGMIWEGNVVAWMRLPDAYRGG